MPAAERSSSHFAVSVSGWRASPGSLRPEVRDHLRTRDRLTLVSGPDLTGDGCVPALRYQVAEGLFAAFKRLT